MKYELKRIDIWPIVKIVFIFSLLLGFFIGILYAGIFLMVDTFSQVAAESGFDEMGSLGGGFAFIVLFGCTFGVSFIYTVGAIIYVVLYNLLAGSLGGFRFELASVDDRDEEKTSVG